MKLMWNEENKHDAINRYFIEPVEYRMWMLNRSLKFNEVQSSDRKIWRGFKVTILNHFHQLVWYQIRSSHLRCDWTSQPFGFLTVDTASRYVTAEIEFLFFAISVKEWIWFLLNERKLGKVWSFGRGSNGLYEWRVRIFKIFGGTEGGSFGIMECQLNEFDIWMFLKMSDSTPTSYSYSMKKLTSTFHQNYHNKILESSLWSTKMKSSS